MSNRRPWVVEIAGDAGIWTVGRSSDAVEELLEEIGRGDAFRKGEGLVAQEGPGNDWRCTVYWHLPGAGAATGAAIYQLDVNPNGRYVADGDGPQEVNGYFILHTSAGDAPNPLWQFDGLIDLLAPTSKG